MRNWIAAWLAASMLTACAGMFGPPAIHLDRSDIAQRSFIDRQEADLGKLFGQFEGLAITVEENGDMLLTGPVIDQAALHGLLKKVRDLGMPLISVNPIPVHPVEPCKELA